MPAAVALHRRPVSGRRPAVSRPCTATRLRVSPATESDRGEIYRIRHAVFAVELGQHPANDAGRLVDVLDAHNVYLVARAGNGIAGFISITPPSAHSFSIDKYLERRRLPFEVDDGVHEVRLLTVRPGRRGGECSAMLMYAAFRWVEAHGGTRIMAIGRREVVGMYRRAGMEPTGLEVRSGAVTFEVLHAPVAALRRQVESWPALVDRLEERVDWQLAFPFRRPAPCFHGGAFFDAIGPRFDTPGRRLSVVAADVLDAWFPPAPGVVSALGEDLAWLLRTSPPTGCEGMLEVLAGARGVRPANLLPGAGSSDLIFRVLPRWLTPASRALVLDPTYGEYGHVLERVIGCRVDRLALHPGDGFGVDPERLREALAGEPDLVVLVNPNSPTGKHLARARLEEVLRRVGPRTRVWVDETYVEYAGPGESLERFAAVSENVVVCKSLSKVYALSGARAAYLCAGQHQLEALRAITPPWVVGLPTQLAVVRALQDPEYYAARYAETAVLRHSLATRLESLGLSVLPGIANFLLTRLPPEGPDAATVVTRCRRLGVYLRDASLMGTRLGTRSLRVAVRDAGDNGRIVEAVAASLGRS